MVDTGDGESAQVRSRALEQALSNETGDFPGVDRATTRLAGRRTQPTARIKLRLTPHASPADAITRLTHDTLPQAQHSLGLTKLPAEIRLRERRHRPDRVQ